MLTGSMLWFGVPGAKALHLGHHLVLEGNLVCLEVACVLVVLVQNSNGWARAAVQKLQVQNLQLIHSDVEGFMKAHVVHWNDLKHTQCCQVLSAGVVCLRGFGCALGRCN